MKTEIKQRYDKFCDTASFEQKMILQAGIATYATYYLSQTESKDAVSTFLDYVDERLKMEGF